MGVAVVMKCVMGTFIQQTDFTAGHFITVMCFVFYQSKHLCHAYMHRDILVHVSWPIDPDFSKSKERFLDLVCHLSARHYSCLEVAVCFY